MREGRAQALEPMSSAERRIVHTVLLELRGRRDGERGPRSGPLRRRAPARPRAELFHVTQRPRVSRETAVAGRARRHRRRRAPADGRELDRLARSWMRLRRRRSASRPSAIPPRPPRATSWTRWRACPRSTPHRPARWPTSAAAAACRASCSRRAPRPRDAPDRGHGAQGGVHRRGGRRARPRGARARRALRGSCPRRAARRLRLRRGASARPAAGGGRAVPPAVPAGRAPRALVARAGERRARLRRRELAGEVRAPNARACS